MTCADVSAIPPTAPEDPSDPSDTAREELRLTQVALGHEASSDPTCYANNHRLEPTAGGRLRTIFGSHTGGLQLAWRDADSATWARNTTGDVGYGQLMWGTGTGDWPASVAVVPRHQGAGEIAVVVRSGQNFGYVRPLAIRLLTDLDSPDGPGTTTPSWSRG